ncbi:FAD-binding oxidoreductase [Rhodothermus profundi]|uniref:FAD/FMN-containing dehydrogenase n=1 Tax=Rhodothermus profundi TaxID=633813 RepID=A0A1M6UCH3_9BACT|nr:FAD-binding oxidoreductase [Rhodothermus profundi]SHK66876.1 FAD/FMN-containing dehydrogenase [Rhodothermus profundi]
MNEEQEVGQGLRQLRVTGEVCRPGTSSYEAARAIWNAMIDRHPALIVRCQTTEDVVQCVRFAREHDQLLAIRGGGHNIAGNALCEGGIVIDLSRMRTVQVDPQQRRATVAGGATLGDLDAATQTYGLAVPVGINSTTGVAGLTLGGGFGWLSRKYGMTVDSLEAAEVVTASGEVLQVDANHHPDLFWALRGGGGNFGVVTHFTFRLYPLGPEVLCGLMVFPGEEALSVLQRYRAFAARAPEELAVWIVMRQAPPLPFLPESVHGRPVIVLALCYAGNPDEGERLIEPLRAFGTLLGEHVGVQPYVNWQQAFDPLLTPGARNYWKSHNLEVLEDSFFEELVDALAQLPSAECELFVGALGGATGRPDPAATAYPHRKARFVMNVHSRWREAADDARCIRWARRVFHRTAPFASGGAYVNFIPADESDALQRAYGDNYARLAQIKRQYDPHNLFRVNQNIHPASA